MDFDRALMLLLSPEREGTEFSDHPDDPGGATRYGVTEAVARRFGYRGDMRALPLDVARQVYREQYWAPIRGDDLPAGLRFDVFDAAVNSGPRTAARWLQRALRVPDDGVIGQKTLAAARAEQDVSGVLMRFNGQRLRALTEFDGWRSFGRGWARRVAANLMREPL